MALGAAAALAVWTGNHLSAEETDRHALTAAPPSQVRPAPRASLQEVTVTRPISVVRQPVVELEGMLTPQQATSLAFSVGGVISRLSARVGDEVKAGARLAQLDTSHAAMQFAVTAARVRAATANLTIAVDHADRNTSLVATGSLHAASAVDSQLQSTVAAAELEAARAQHSEAQLALNEHTLRAPFAGTVVEAPDAIGAVVGPGTPLFRLAKLKTLKLNATVTEAEAARLAVDGKVLIDTKDGPVEGRITRVLATLDAARRVPVEAEIEAPGRLRAGAFVRARAETRAPEHALRLPSDVLRKGTNDEIFVVLPGEPPTLVARRIVHDVDSSGALLIRSGVGADEVVVASPKPKTSSGDAVVIANGQMLDQTL